MSEPSGPPQAQPPERPAPGAPGSPEATRAFEAQERSGPPAFGAPEGPGAPAFGAPEGPGAPAFGARGGPGAPAFGAPGGPGEAGGYEVSGGFGAPTSGPATWAPPTPQQAGQDPAPGCAGLHPAVGYQQAPGPPPPFSPAPQYGQPQPPYSQASQYGPPQPQYGQPQPPYSPAPPLYGPAQPRYAPVSGYAVQPAVVAFRDGQPVPTTERVDMVPGTEFGVALTQVPATVSGPAVGSLVAGIAADLVSLVATCIGVGTPAGILASGAFAILGTVAGAAGVGLGLLGMRQARRSGGRVTGRGLAIAGISCGGAGILITGLGVLGAIAAHAGSGA